MKLVLSSKQDLKKFHKWLTDKIGELNSMELEDIAHEAFMAGMRESQNVIDDLRNDLVEYVKLHSKVTSELNTANHKLMQIEDLAKRESGLRIVSPLGANMEIDKRKLSFNLATKSCEVLAVNVTAEKLWSLVEAFEPILESGLTQRAADLPLGARKIKVL